MSINQKIVLLAVVFDSKSELINGMFREIIRPSAVERTFAEEIDVRAMVNHDQNMLVGRLSAGTLHLLRDPEGLRAEIVPPDTSYARDIVASIGRGDIDGASFWFQSLKDQWSVEDGEDLREVLDARIYEVSPVVFPAYSESDASLAARSSRRTVADFRRLLYHAEHALDYMGQQGDWGEARSVGIEGREGEKELAMMKWPNGEVVHRGVALDGAEHFRKAVRERFGAVPLSTGNWRWSRNRGWFEVGPTEPAQVPGLNSQDPRERLRARRLRQLHAMDELAADQARK